MSFDFSAAWARSSVETHAFKGALDALFESQRARLPAEAAQNSARAAEEAEEQAKQDAQQAEDAGQKQAEEDKKRKREEQAKEAQEQEEKRLKTEEETRKQAALAVKGGEEAAKKSKTDKVIGELSSPATAIVFRGGPTCPFQRGRQQQEDPQGHRSCLLDL
jgi:hypothetical protein